MKKIKFDQYNGLSLKIERRIPLFYGYGCLYRALLTVLVFDKCMNDKSALIV